MDALSVELAALSTDDETFLAYKRAVFAYLDEFVARLATQVPEIGAVISALDDRIAGLVDVAATADQAPTLDGDDGGVRRSLQERCSGIRAWFVRSRPEEASIAGSLRLAMLDAINRILAALDRLHERHLRRVSREADFTQLAWWFAAMEDEDAALLWDRAFGLWSPRHFAELAGDEEEERNKSFWDAAPAEVAPRLRTSGVRAGPGRPARAASYIETKAAGLLAVREAHRQADMALERLAGRAPIRLSDLNQLDRHEFAALLSVIDAALASPPDRDGRRTASTVLVAVTLRPLDASGEPHPEAVIRTPAGTLRCADSVLEISLTGRAARARREERTG
jgi:uncharacterized protein (TIGR02677 family)